MKRWSFDARSWDHPSHPFMNEDRCGFAMGETRVSARVGWEGETDDLFEQPAESDRYGLAGQSF
jgi:hypothetical protein